MFRIELQAWIGRWADLGAAVFAALAMALLAPITIDFRADLPITLQSLLVLWLPWVLGWRAGLAGVLAYLAMGAMGLPVFAGGAHGIAPLFGNTGGYLLAFPIAATLVGLWGEQVKRLHYIQTGCALLAGHGLILAGGMFWQFQIEPPAITPWHLLRLLAPAITVKCALGVLLTVLMFRGITRAQGSSDPRSDSSQ